jgi:hypothetical protein
MAGKLTPNRDRFNFGRFIDSIPAHANFRQAFDAIQRECTSVERMMSGRGGPQTRADGGAHYASKLKRVANWFHTGFPPPAATADEIAACQRFAERFVATGELNPATLDRFKAP